MHHGRIEQHRDSQGDREHVGCRSCGDSVRPPVVRETFVRAIFLANLKEVLIGDHV